MTVKTIKLPISGDEQFNCFITYLQFDFTRVVGKLYQKLKSKLTQKEATTYLNSLETNLDSWFMQSAYYEAKALLDSSEQLYQLRLDEWKNNSAKPNYKRKRKPKQYLLFGGKKNRIDYDSGKIEHETYQLNKLLPVYVVGEAKQSGNRKFELDIDNNQIIFKFNRKQHFILKLPKLRNNYQKQLSILQQLAENKAIPFTVRLTKTWIAISFTEPTIEVPTGRNVLGIDLNPNYIGVSIQTPEQEILFTRVYDISKLIDADKQKYELSIIAKELQQLSKYYEVCRVVFEDLTTKKQDHSRGRAVNKLWNNKWNKSYFVNCLVRRAKINGLIVKKVSAAYSSTIGNIKNNKFTDPVASSIEIGRRSIDGQLFFPEFKLDKEVLNHQLADLGVNLSGWKEYHDALKKSKLRYRVPLPSGEVFKTLQSHKSLVKWHSGLI